MTKKKILFAICGNKKLGLGHIYNALSIVDGLNGFEIIFFVESDLAFKKIRSLGYNVKICKNNIVQNILSYNPDMVISDRLDTSKRYINSLKSNKIKCVNFEDLGAGAKEADIVFNAMYPQKIPMENEFVGPDYFILRKEFTKEKQIKIKNKVKKILIAFGGTDPQNLTLFVLEAIYRFCMSCNIRISILCGFGYNNYHTIDKFKNINILMDVKNVAEIAVDSDLIFTGGGRTTFEMASLGIPTIVLTQNDRELTHLFSSSENGFLNLGLGVNNSKKNILKEFSNLCDNKELRLKMSSLMKRNDLTKGRIKVINLIKALIKKDEN